MKNISPYKNIILILLLAVCLSFIFILGYFNKSPQSLLITLFGKFIDHNEQFDNTNLYHYTKPVDEFETVSSILKILDDVDAGNGITEDIGLDVTDNFRNYARLASDFSNLSSLITTWDNKYLAFNKSKIFLFEILGNKIYLKSIKVPEIKEIRFAYIFKSGNILFCDHNTAYYSHDNLKTYHKSTVLDTDGREYLTNNLGNFFNLVIDGRQIIDGKEIRVWGNYTNYGIWQPGIMRSEQVQVWYTVDEGKTIKVAYKFGSTIPQLKARHIHAVNMCPWDNTFWVQTGDMTNECHWIQGKYNWEKDAWSWDLKASGDHMSFFKSTGFVFFDNQVYWADDSSDPQKHGIWKTPYINMTAKNIDTKLFEKVFDTDKEIIELVGNNEGHMIASQYFKSDDNKYKIFNTYDGGQTWSTNNTAFQIINMHPPNIFGHILGNYFINQETFEAVQFWDVSPSLFVNSYLKK